MERANRILASVRSIKLFLGRTAPSSRSLHFQLQASQYSSLFSSFNPSSSGQNAFFNTHHHHQKIYFSSKPNSIVELVNTNKWSQEELDKFHPSTLSHETIVYVVKKLGEGEGGNPKKASDFFNWVSSTQNGFKPSSLVYNLMLRILANKQTMREFWLTLKQMSNQSCDIDDDTYCLVLHKGLLTKCNALARFFNVYRDSANDPTLKVFIDAMSRTWWDDELGEKLEQLKIISIPSENTILKVLRAFRYDSNKSLCFFRWVGRRHKHNAVTYNAILWSLALHNTVEEFWCIVEEMKSAGHFIDLDTYIKVSTRFQNHAVLIDAVKLFEFMVDSPYKPSIGHCNSLLQQLSLHDSLRWNCDMYLRYPKVPDMEELDLHFRVLNKFEAIGYALSKPIYDRIHKTLVSVERFDEAETILKAMKEAGFEPDYTNYRWVISGLCKAGRLEEARKMFNEMEKQECVPDFKTWSTLIQRHCVDGEVEQALKFYSQMLETNFTPDKDLLEVLVNGLCSKQKVDKMGDKANLNPWCSIYKNVIKMLLGERKLEAALSLHSSTAKKHGYQPFPQLFIDYLSKNGTVEDALKFQKAFSVSSSAYVHVLRSFLKEGRQSEAQDLLYKLPHPIRNHSNSVLLL